MLSFGHRENRFRDRARRLLPSCHEGPRGGDGEAHVFYSTPPLLRAWHLDTALYHIDQALHQTPHGADSPDAK